MSGDLMDGRPSKIVYETQSGVMMHITPINIAVLRAIQLKAELLYPYPDKRPYQTLETNGFVEGQLTPAEENPDYIKACSECDSVRHRWADRAIFDYTVTLPKYPTHEALIDGFKNELKRLKEIAEFKEDDDYEIILFNLVLTWNKVALNSENVITATATEYGKVVTLALQSVPLTADEVSAGIRFFRPDVPKPRT